MPARKGVDLENEDKVARDIYTFAWDWGQTRFGILTF